MVADKRKPRDKPPPYQRQPKKPKVNDTPATSAQPAAHTAARQNLTLNDWLTVFAYIDAHPAISQCDIERSTLEARINDNPNALSSKRPRTVTRPDVGRALFLWVKQMEEKGEHVNGPMLKEKRRKFEELLEVPEDERLSGDGWLTPFCKAYKIREHRRHGEAGSVDLDAVEVERKRCEEILSKFAPRDRWNFDGTTIIIMVKQEMAEKAGQVIEVESDEEDNPQPEVSRAEMLALSPRTSKEAASSSEMLTPQFHWTS
ncbi:hypothetical protein AZE42_10564 [Rhizopogon vesiculosus]|uniref:HTH CENPB-type domain-containing protein n=1 Tax=Rhizopogon vesiculosus TaxID=180088 RepID=A0A1J8Q8U3_9AGAM|nr:hypothetical protein AZE42_10564 [Rhizopogon vesiculosus]